jgi:hypothetical protein
MGIKDFTTSSNLVLDNVLSMFYISILRMDPQKSRLIDIVNKGSGDGAEIVLPVSGGLPDTRAKL